ncbi:hypothetical protein [Streptomyces sp. NPDC093111]|uniref:hypothetical protein n=1 Tax=Streptomyces sp. NPDC093111 TaxID=3154978 RepID=UPI003449102B
MSGRPLGRLGGGVKDQPTFRPIPGPGFVATLLTSTWLTTPEDADPLGWLLVAHAGARRAGETPQSVEASLMGMAETLCLAPAARTLRNCGERLIVRAGAAALHYGHPTTVLRLSHTARSWMTHVSRGGPVVIALGLDPIPPGAGRDAVEEYLHRAARAGRVHLGATGLYRGRA